MTVEELKDALIGKDFPEKVVLGSHLTVVDVEQFLRIQFLECELWKGDIEKCPAFLRLVSFYEVVNNQR